MKMREEIGVLVTREVDAIAVLVLSAVVQFATDLLGALPMSELTCRESADAVEEVLKVEMFARAIRFFRRDCEVIGLATNISTRDAVLAACQADLLVSCVDTADGGHIADRLAASRVLQPRSPVHLVRLQGFCQHL
jgi:hypothetical protein